MSELQFEEEQEFRTVGAEAQRRGLIGLVQKWGLARDDTQAQYVLVGVAFVCILLAIAFYVFLQPSNSSGSTIQTPVSERSIPGPGGRATGVFSP